VTHAKTPLPVFYIHTTRIQITRTKKENMDHHDDEVGNALDREWDNYFCEPRLPENFGRGLYL